ILLFNFDIRNARKEIETRVESLRVSSDNTDKIVRDQKEFLERSKQDLADNNKSVAELNTKLRGVLALFTQDVVDHFGDVLLASDSNPSQAREFYRTILRLSEDEDVTPLRYLVLRRLVDLEWNAGNYDEAKARYKEIEDLTIKNGDTSEQAAALMDLGLLEMHTGERSNQDQRFDVAMNLFTEAQRLFDKLGDIAGSAGALVKIADAY